MEFFVISCVVPITGENRLVELSIERVFEAIWRAVLHGYPHLRIFFFENPNQSL